MRLLPDDRHLGWTPWAWLIYTVPFFFATWAERGDGPVFAANVAAMAVFLGLYFRSYWLRGARLVLVIAGVTLLGFVVTPINPFASVFFIYAAAMVAFIDRQRPRLWHLGLHIAVVTTYGLLTRQRVEFFIPAVGIAAVIGAVNIHYAEVWVANAKIRLAQTEVERLAKMAERERIARDLHDVLGHTLSVIALKSELASKLIDRDPARAAQEIREVNDVARDALAQVRGAVTGYRAAGLSAEFEAMKRAFATAGITLEVDVEAVTLPPSHENALALVLREASTNVLRHARASACRVRLVNRNGVALLEIADNGRGGDAREGNGFAGMRERITALGGNLLRDGGAGMRIEISLPLPAGTA